MGKKSGISISRRNILKGLALLKKAPEFRFPEADNLCKSR
jgi:hypothetical protein